MAIDDKTRKILWARSGNRCAVCNAELVQPATALDPEAVVGDECHIVSSKEKGPRFNPAFPAGRHDTYGNLLLLCKVHHKLVDDQPETYTAERLRAVKAEHEAAVKAALQPSASTPRPRLRRVRANIPSHLVRVTSGKVLVDLLSSTLAMYFEHPEPANESEVGLISGFAEELRDWADVLSGLEPGESVRAGFALSQRLGELGSAGLVVHIAREVQFLEGTPGPPADWPVAHVRVARRGGAGRGDGSGDA